MNTILVTGASGNVGRPLVNLLANAGLHVRAVSRSRGLTAWPAGVEAIESPTEEVEKILGRPATPFAQWISVHRDIFTDS